MPSSVLLPPPKQRIPNSLSLSSPLSVLEGQFNEALNFVMRFESNYSYDAKEINYIINKHKFVELLCLVKSEGGFHNSELTQKELLNCLTELERCCSSKEEYHKFVVQLDLTTLDQHLDFQV